MVFCSYSYSDEVTGTTSNAAAGGYTWSMQDILPPEAGLIVNGMFYRYTTNKDPNADMTVTIQNEHLTQPGTYVIKETDDWSGLPAGTIVKRIDLPNISRDVLGEGSIVTTGEGTVEDPTVVYNYRFDECYFPLNDPSCPGYLDALYDWLNENGFLDSPPAPGDPYYDEWVQATLSRESDSQDEDEDDKERREEQEEDAKDEEGIQKLNQGVTIEGLVDGQDQNAVINALAAVPNFDAYMTVTIPGGAYNETITLDGGELKDNRRALNNLAQDQVHKDMVRSQYDN